MEDAVAREDAEGGAAMSVGMKIDEAAPGLRRDDHRRA